jgi:DNA gyrase/topoisomerase IV subunit A
MTKALLETTALTPSEYILMSSREYSIYIAANRAIPAVTDGLKYGQRIALWLLRNKADKIKTMALGGMCTAEKLYVHGDVSINNAISLLAAPYSNNVMLIEGLGHFGSRLKPGAEGIGAPRYTEVRRSKAASAFLYNDLDLVPLGVNYDGSVPSPINFLPIIPTVLLNGISGIAVGYSTSILPRSHKAIVQATLDAIQGRPIKRLVPHYERYDITVKEGVKDNQWQFDGKLEIVDTSTIRITELPPGLSIAEFRKRLMALVDKTPKEQDEEGVWVVDYIDRSTKTINIDVKFKRGSLKGWTKPKAIAFFKLQERVTERIVVLSWDQKKVITYDTAEKLVQDFVEWRLGFYTKRYEKMVIDTNDELSYWRILQILFKNGFTKKLGTFVNRTTMADEVRAIVKKAKIIATDAHIERAIGLPTYRWTKDFESEIVGKIEGYEADIKSYRETLADPAKLKAVYVGELEELKKLRF